MEGGDASVFLMNWYIIKGYCRNIYPNTLP